MMDIIRDCNKRVNDGAIICHNSDTLPHQEKYIDKVQSEYMRIGF